jgi:hypothetical protein
MESGAPTEKPLFQKADWEGIIQECKDGQGQEPFTSREFWETYVQGAVTLQRTRNKLDELHAQGKLLRIVNPRDGAYVFMWVEQELK